MSESLYQGVFLSHVLGAACGWSFLVPVPAKEGHVGGVRVCVDRYLCGVAKSLWIMGTLELILRWQEERTHKYWCVCRLVPPASIPLCCLICILTISWVDREEIHTTHTSNFVQDAGGDKTWSPAHPPPRFESSAWGSLCKIGPSGPFNFLLRHQLPWFCFLFYLLEVTLLIEVFSLVYILFKKL